MYLPICVIAGSDYYGLRLIIQKLYLCIMAVNNESKPIPGPSIVIFKADVSTELPLAYADAGIKAGFPSPAGDFPLETIDLNKDLIDHPAATFYGRVSGDSMAGEGITDGDILVIDRSLEPEEGDLAVCCIEGEFTVKRIHRGKSGCIWLVPSNHAYEPIRITPDNEFIVWGIVSHTIKPNRRRRL